MKLKLPEHHNIECKAKNLHPPNKLLPIMQYIFQGHASLMDLQDFQGHEQSNAGCCYMQQCNLLIKFYARACKINST